MSRVTAPVTAEELGKFPRDDYRYELVEGRVIRMSPVGSLHGATVVGLLLLLGAHVRSRRLGVVFTETGFKLASRPDTVRAPDVAFVRQARVSSALPDGFWQGPPDLAIEVLSPDDRPAEVRTKVEEYLSSGASLVVVVDPVARTATVFRPHASEEVVTERDALDLGDVIHGFRCQLRDALPE